MMSPKRNGQNGLGEFVRNGLSLLTHFLTLVGLDDAYRGHATPIEVNPHRLILPPLGEAFDGLRIALLSDLHFGPLVDLTFVARAVDLVNAIGADLIAVAGDVVRDSSRATPVLGAELARLRAPMGVLTVTGNHDLWGRPGRTDRMLRRAGLRVLHNECVVYRRGGDCLCVGGVPDIWKDSADPQAAFADAPAGACRILLSHNPDVVDCMPAGLQVDLTLSGHTHGGQVVIPHVPQWLTPASGRMIAGLCNAHGRPVFVSRGVGVAGLPIRFRCPPEVPVLELRRT